MDATRAAAALPAVAAADATQTCLSEVNAAWQACYEDSDTACSADDPAISAALDALELTATESCTDGELMSLDVTALVGRLQTSGSSEATSLASRSYGGPQGAVWAEGDATDQACIQAAQLSASNQIPPRLAVSNQIPPRLAVSDHAWRLDQARSEAIPLFWLAAPTRSPTLLDALLTP